MADIQISAEIDDKGVEQGTAKMGAEIKAFAQGAKSETEKLAKEQEKIESKRESQFEARSRRFAKVNERVAKGASLAASGQVGGNLLEKTAMVAAQFGPQGEIIAGVIAIGSAIYEWAEGEDKAKEEANKLAESMAEAAKQQHEINTASKDRTEDDKNAAAVVEKRSRGEDEIAEKLELQFEFEKKIREIKERNEKAGVLKQNTDAEIENAKKLYEIQQHQLSNKQAQERAEKSDEKSSKIREEKQRTEEIIKQTDELKKQLTIEDSAHKLARLGGEIDQINRASGFNSTDQERAKSALEIVKRQVEIKKTADEIVKSTEEATKKWQDGGDAVKKITDDVANMFGEFQKGLTDIDNTFNQGIAKSIMEAQARMGQQVLDRASDIRHPGQKDARDKEERLQKNAERTAAEQIVDENNLKNGGKVGHHFLSPAERKAAVDAKIRDAEKIRNAGKNKVNIDSADIDKLAQTIATETAKQIAK